MLQKRRLLQDLRRIAEWSPVAGGRLLGVTYAENDSAILRTASMAAVISSVVVHQPTLKRRAPPEFRVPSLLWASGAQCSPARH